MFLSKDSYRWNFINSSMEDRVCEYLPSSRKLLWRPGITPMTESSAWRRLPYRLTSGCGINQPDRYQPLSELYAALPWPVFCPRASRPSISIVFIVWSKMLSAALTRVAGGVSGSSITLPSVVTAALVPLQIQDLNSFFLAPMDLEIHSHLESRTISTGGATLLQP